MTQELDIWRDESSLTDLKKIFGKDLTDSEFKVMRGIGAVTGLNPYLRELWAVKYGNSPAQIFIGRDGYRKAAQTNPDYDYHLVDAVYANDTFSIEDGAVKHTYSVKERGALVGAYSVVKRKSATKTMFTFVDLKEYSTGKSLWTSKPATMIKKVAEAQGLRMAFQQLFAGTYDEAEAWEDKQKPVNYHAVVHKGETINLNTGIVSKPITHEQLFMLDAMAARLGKTADDLRGLVTKNFNKSVEELTEVEASGLIDELEKRAIALEDKQRAEGVVVIPVLDVIEPQSEGGKKMKEAIKKASKK